MRLFITRSALAALGLLICACGPRDGAAVLKLGHVLDVSHPVHLGMEHMAELVKERSGGRLVIEIYPSGQLGNERTLIEQVKVGAIDMVKTSTAPLEGFEARYAVFSLPFIFRDDDHYWRVLNGPVGRELLQAAEKIGLHGLCYYDAGSRSFYTSDRPILTPDDLAGLKIRVMKSPASMDMVSALGGSPTPIGWGELYTALEQGTVDGAENNPPSFYTSRHYEVCKQYSLDEHSRPPDILLVNVRRFESLAPDLREILERAADESVVFQRELWARKTEEALAEVAKAGVRVVRPDRSLFAAKVQDMLAGYRGTAIGDLLKRIDETE